jgi:hypothetical protein
MQKVIKLFHQLFNNQQVYIVFTKCEAGVQINKSNEKGRLPEAVLNLLHECGGAKGAERELPVFLVDSPTGKRISKQKAS